MPAPAFVVAMSAVKNDTGTTLTITKDAAVADGHVLVAAVVVRSAITVTAPGGWTDLASSPQLSSTGGPAARLYAWQKVASSEGASWDFTLSAASEAAGGVIAISEANTTTPVDVTAGDVDTSGFDTEATAPSVTTTQVDTLLVALLSWGAGGTARTATPPTGMTERVDVSATGTQKTGIEIATVAQAAAGASGTQAATLSASSAEDACILVAIAPAAGGKIKAYVSGAFVAKPVKVWTGSAWVVKPLKRWNGSSWVTTPY